MTLVGSTGKCDHRKLPGSDIIVYVIIIILINKKNLESIFGILSFNNVSCRKMSLGFALKLFLFGRELVGLEETG